MLAHRRLATTVVCALAAFTMIVPAVPATAADTGSDLLPGWTFLGATVTGTCPGSPTPRHMSGRHAMAFVQSWYVATIYGTLTAENPPPSLPKCTFKATDRIGSKPYTFTAFYATNGKKAWVGLPPQTIGPSAFVPVEKWFIATPRATPGIQGVLEPARVGGTTTTTPTTTTTSQKPAHKSSGGGAGWVIAVGVIVVGIALIVVLGRSRRRAKS
jgi:hypothetical protein